ncbi:MAG: YbaB/EbfC family nucleoid-associated protein [Bacteroidota bacterium]|jgi:nucleoid-associated protein EbfC
MFGKLAEAQQKAEEVKQKLEAITVEGDASNGLVKVGSTGNKKIYEIIIADELMAIDRKEELQDLLIIAIDRAMTAAENVSQSEMQALMSTMMPGGLGSLFGKK